jgi:hypothetical protein
MVLLAIAAGVGARFAPDVAPELPIGWCDTRYGSPTATTGECICAEECEGRGCQRQLGFVFYEYTACPTCKCVPKKSDSRVAKGGGGGEVEARQSEEQDMDIDLQQGFQRAPKNQNKRHFAFEDDEEQGGGGGGGGDGGLLSDLSLWVEENGRLLFALVVGLVMAAIIVVMIVVSMSASPKSSSKGSQSPKGASADTGKDSREPPPLSPDSDIDTDAKEERSGGRQKDSEKKWVKVDKSEAVSKSKDD